MLIRCVGGPCGVAVRLSWRRCYFAVMTFHLFLQFDGTVVMHLRCTYHRTYPKVMMI